MATSWKEALQKKLQQTYSKQKGLSLYKKYADGFSFVYIDEYSVTTALNDIQLMEELTTEHPIQIKFYYATNKETNNLHLRLFQWNKPIPLSDILPMLENLDLRVDSEHPYEVLLRNHTVWISDFIVIYSKPSFAIEQLTGLFEEAFSKVYFGLLENDSFNKLVLGASLSWREITILRAYAKYLHQVGFRFSQPYIEKALTNNAAIAKNLIELFKATFDPLKAKNAEAKITKIKQNILQSLESVASLDEDRIIRRILDLILCTLRTNYFQTTEDNQPKDYLSIKFNSRLIPDLPAPVPLYEIFVYSPRFESIHLRNTKVARGGIRWSDRREDFRTEILGLMKAQTVKNAIIIPSGAKGGFVIKKDLANADRESKQLEVIECYKSFIRGLLDLTDNIKNNKSIPPKNVVCYDDADTYLVVAADKGTATFSDIANDISKEYDFWLGDAFASGGKTGYDHKKMGITARGAWESIKRHFRELHVNIYETSITIIGVGDMSGDVFGNGMLYTKKLKLVGAFDHRNIFIDPDPDPLTSFKERLRLFNLPTSSWEDYNPKLISKGGGVFKRSAKSIALTPQMQKVLATDAKSLTPNELIQVLLKAPVDLLFNGGIGTYVKASSENQDDVGDRTNDYCRVNGNELRCKTVGEGGNLGFTQLGRVEYAMNGGLINTDFIDNSAGVDCSDHEVNLKILLNHDVNQGKLTETKRNKLLASLTEEVAELVLEDNYDQALVMSFSAFHAKENLSLHITYIKELENLGILKRKVEFLPTDKELIERKAAGGSLTRPELAILLAYTKIYIKQEILKSSLPKDPYLKRVVQMAFPESIRKKYSQEMDEHRLYREIIATELSNQLINKMGIIFVYRTHMETGATVEEIVRAYTIASNIFGTNELQKLIESLDFKIPMAEQYEMLFNIRNLINLSTRWFLHSDVLHNDLATTIKHFSERIVKLENITPRLMSGATKQYAVTLSERFQQAGLSKEIAQRIAMYRAIYTSLNIISVSSKYNLDLIKTAKVYFASGEKLNLVWFRDQIANDAREGHWNVLARLSLRDELDIAQRGVTLAIMQTKPEETNETALINAWARDNKQGLARWERLLTMLYESGNIDYTMFFIAIRELIGLIILSLQKIKLYQHVSSTGQI